MRMTSSLLVGLCLLAAAPLSLAAGRMTYRKGAPREANPSWIVTGYGVTVQDAQTNALTEASRSVADYLAKNHPAVAWAPPGRYLEQRGVVRADGKPAEEDFELSGRMFAVSLRVEITPQLLEQALRMSRQQRMEERQRGLALGLGGTLAVLIVLGGYLRLEEATRGNSMRVLRLTAAAGVLAAAGVGLWLLADHGGGTMIIRGLNWSLISLLAAAGLGLWLLLRFLTGCCSSR